MKALPEKNREAGRKNSFGAHEFICSATECTGLIPTLTPEDPDGEFHEAMLYGIHAPKKRNGIPNEEKPDAKGK